VLTDRYCSVLGVCGLQRRRVCRHREPAAAVHGRAPSAAGPRQYNQLPSVANAKVRHEPAEAKVRPSAADRYDDKEEEGEEEQTRVTPQWGRHERGQFALQ